MNCEHKFLIRDMMKLIIKHINFKFKWYQFFKNQNFYLVIFSDDTAFSA